jgi:hypothetical protein
MRTFDVFSKNKSIIFSLCRLILLAEHRTANFQQRHYYSISAMHTVHVQSFENSGWEEEKID